MNAKPYLQLLALLCGLVVAVQSNAGNPHEITPSSQTDGCMDCHVNAPPPVTADLLTTKNSKVDLSSFKANGVEMCSGCHNPDDGHKVNIKLDFDVPADLPLGEKNKLTCLTCHYTHGDLHSNRPQASVSFMDSLFNAERLQKSYLLRRNNAQGELCLTCHEIKQ